MTNPVPQSEAEAFGREMDDVDISQMKEASPVSAKQQAAPETTEEDEG